MARGRKHGSIGTPKEIDPEALRGILRTIHKKLKSAGVPEYRLPKNEMIVSMLVEWVDHTKVAEWIKKYASIAAE